MSNAYRWASGSRHRVSADIAGEVCDRLAKENNLSAQTLVDVSRDEKARFTASLNGMMQKPGKNGEKHRREM